MPIVTEEILDYWNIGILENSYWNPGKFQYFNISRERGNIGVLYYWNTGILENFNIPIISQEIILEYWNSGKFQYSNSYRRNIGILLSRNPEKFQYVIL